MSSVWKKNKLKFFREQANLTQDQLAKLLNVSQPTIQRWENGTREPSLQDLKNLCKILGVKYYDLVEID